MQKRGNRGNEGARRGDKRGEGGVLKRIKSREMKKKNEKELMGVQKGGCVM